MTLCLPAYLIASALPQGAARTFTPRRPPPRPPWNRARGPSPDRRAHRPGGVPRPGDGGVVLARQADLRRLTRCAVGRHRRPPSFHAQGSSPLRSCAIGAAGGSCASSTIVHVRVARGGIVLNWKAALEKNEGGGAGDAPPPSPGRGTPPGRWARRSGEGPRAVSAAAGEAVAGGEGASAPDGSADVRDTPQGKGSSPASHRIHQWAIGRRLTRSSRSPMLMPCSLIALPANAGIPSRSSWVPAMQE